MASLGVAMCAMQKKTSLFPLRGSLLILCEMPKKVQTESLAWILSFFGFFGSMWNLQWTKMQVSSFDATN